MAAGKKKPEKKKADISGTGHSLRDDAEEQLARSLKPSPASTGQTPEALIHELQVHQIELEAQAEELRKLKLALEESRDTYLDLYDFAPLGYFTLSDKALITGANLTGAKLLGVERSRLVNAQFRKFVAEKDTDEWQWYFMNVLNQKEKRTCTLLLKRAGGPLFPARLESVLITGSDGTNTVRIAIIDIPESSRAEEALIESERRFRELSDLLPQTVYEADVNGILTYANRIGFERFGHTEDEFKKGLNVLQMIAPHDRERAGAAFRAIFEGTERRGGSNEYQALKKDGSTFPISIYSSAIIVQGRITGLRGIIIDNTERKRAEEALKENEQRLIAAQHIAKLGDITWNVETGEVAWSDALYDLMQYDKSEKIDFSRVNAEIHHPDDLERVTKWLNDCIASGSDEITPNEYRIIRKDGKILFVHTVGVIHRGEGNQVKVFITLQDITERKLAEEALRERNSLIRALIDNLPFDTWAMDYSGKYILQNQVSISLWGDFIGKTIPRIHVPAYLIEHWQDNNRKVLMGTSVRGELSVSSEGGMRIYDEIIAPIRVGDEIRGIIGVNIDITERKRAEEALRESEEKYRLMFENIQEGFALHEIITDETGNAVDFRFLDANAAYERHTGLKPGAIIGKTMREILPQADPRQIENYGKVALMGEPLVIEYFSKTFGRYLRTRAFCPQRGRFAAIFEDITERKQAEEALRESHDRFEATIASLDDAVFLVDPVTRLISECNAAATRIFGYSYEELVGRGTGFLHVDQAHLEQFSREVNATYDDPGYYRREFEMRRKDGCVFPTEHFVRPIHDPDGRIQYVVSVVRDITERRRAEEALKESEEKFRTTIGQSTDGILITDGDFNIIEWNAAQTTIYGNTRDEMLGKPLWEFQFATLPKEQKSPGFLEKIKRSMLKHRASPDTVWMNSLHDFDVQRGDGLLKTVQISTFPIVFRDRILFGSISRDITDSKQAGERLRESNERLRLITENMVDLIAQFDAQAFFQYVSPSYEKILGYRAEDLVGKSAVDFIHPDERDEIIPAIDAMLRLGAGATQFRYLHKDGSYRWIESTGRNLLNADGQVIGSIMGSRDISERKQSEQTIQHALAEKEVLLREIHHRVKNNLAGILSLIELQISSLSDPVQIAPFKELETRIRSMALVHDSLSRTQDLARINVGIYTENLTRHLLSGYGTANEVRCRIEMGDITLPIETATPCGLVMNEIITNSLKYAFPKTFSCKEIRGEPCMISLTLQREGSDYILIVADNGIGMPERTDATMSHSLGLFLIRFIVEHQLRGSLAISTAGGTAYTIRFPEPEVKERNTYEKM